VVEVGSSQRRRYMLSRIGITHLVRDYYSRAVTAAGAAVLATGGIGEVARRLVVPCAVMAAMSILLAFVLPSAWRQTLLAVAGIALVLSLVAYAVYLPNSE